MLKQFLFEALLISVGNRGPNPWFSPPRPWKIGGEDGDDLNFEVFRVFIPEYPPKKFGDILGTGMVVFLRGFGVYSPKELKFWSFPEKYSLTFLPTIKSIIIIFL